MFFALIASQLNCEATAAASCLDTTVLTNLGLFNVAGAESDDTSLTSEHQFCKTLYTASGRCVTNDTIKTAIGVYQTEFSVTNKAFKNIADIFDTFFGNIGESLSALWTKVSGKSDDEQNKKTWKEEMAAKVKKANETKDQCFKNFNLYQHGLSCLLSSGKAVDRTSVTESQVTVTSDKTVLSLVTECMDVMATICMFFKGGDEAEVESKETDEQKAICQKVNTYEGCMEASGTETSCLSDSDKESIFNMMFKPYKNALFPKVADVESYKDKVLSFFGNVKDKVFSWTKSTDETNPETPPARILSESMDVTFTFVADGQNLKKEGEDSGIEVQASSIKSVTVMILAMACYLRFN